MTVSHSDLADLLAHSGHHLTIIVQERNRSTTTYAAHEVAIFVEHPTKRYQPHTVTDDLGDLVYRQDADGAVELGNAEELVVNMERDKLIRAQQFTNATRRAIQSRSQHFRS